MCKASIHAPSVREAKTGDKTVICFSKQFGFPQFMRKTDRTQGTVTCAKFGQQMSISNIPREAQKMYRIKETIIVTFIEDIDDNPDRFLLEDGRLLYILDIVWEREYDGKVRAEMLEMLDEEDLRRTADLVAGRMADRFRHKDRQPALLVT